MKAIFLTMILSLFMVAGCSSKKKEVETTVNNEVEQVENTVEEVQEEVTEAVNTAKEMSSETASSFTCSLGSDQRSVEIVNGESPKCEVFYTKNGEKLSVARANWDFSYCEKVASQVKGNLDNAGFSCN